MSLTLYANKFSTCTQRVLFTAAEVGPQAKLDYHKVDMKTGQHKSAEHLARQPFGKVPAAVLDGTPFYESRAICRILAEQQHSTLLPTQLQQKAVFEQWASLESNSLAPQLDVIMMELVFKPMRKAPTDQAAVDKAREGLTKMLEVLNEQLGKHDYIAGDFSLVDIFQAPNFHHLSKLEAGKEIFATYPHIGAWWKRLSARPGWTSTLEQVAKD